MTPFVFLIYSCGFGCRKIKQIFTLINNFQTNSKENSLMVVYIASDGVIQFFFYYLFYQIINKMCFKTSWRTFDHVNYSILFNFEKSYISEIGNKIKISP